MEWILRAFDIFLFIFALGFAWAVGYIQGMKDENNK